MAPEDPALFYTGLVAQAYAALRSVAPDPEPYARFIALSGQPALELGCGDGDPLLELRARGLDIEGLDSSPDMLARCRAAAAERNLVVTLHESPIESMELVRRYRSIFLAGATFNLLVDDDTAWRALARIRAHLEPKGSAHIPLFVPRPTPADQVGVPRTHVTDDGVTLRVTVLGDERDDEARLQTTRLLYEVESGGVLQREERDWLLHWHTQEGFRQLVGDAGLLVGGILAADGTLAGPDDEQFSFWLTVDPAFDARPSIRDRMGPGRQALAAGMLGLDQAIYGERPKVEIVAEADADGLDLGDIDLDLDDPTQSRMSLDPDDG
ncbi:MAG: class I SAM-dependent methyltransferase [Acidimicrobiales bacterium]